MDAVERKRKCDVAAAAGTSEGLPGSRDRKDAMHVTDLHLAVVVETEIVKKQAQWRGPEIKARWDANRASAAKGADGAIPA